MAAPKKGRGSSGGQGRPGRALALILIAMVALTGGMFLSGHTTPRLGIDLAGGTSITLKAKSQPGKPEAINETNMNTAVSIIERRVNGLGVSEAEVQTQGASNIIVNIPKGTNSAQAREQVGTTAQLYFRPVLTVAGGAPTPEGSASPSATGSGKPSATPSAKASDPETASDPKATPSDGATTQGRAVTGALKKDATPTPSGAAESDAPAATETPDAATAALQKKFTELDCTDKAARAAAGDGVKPEDPTVACSSEGDAKYLLGPAEVSGTDVDDAKAQFDQQRGIWLVSMEFTDKGSKKFQTITKKLSTQQSPANQFAISLDGEVVSAPQVNETLSGSAEISGSFTQQSAEDLANVLSYGALPLSFSEDTVTTVTAALGGEQLEAGLIAGAIGLALVVIYLVAYYRGLALIALLSLVASGILTYTIMALLGPAIGFALNLPAVCGAIVAIGITADSFIVYFERIRDEIREGRTLRPAVERAWPRARRTILVSDFVSFLAAAVLFLVTVGKVQGFAFTLGLTTLLDVVVVFLFTKPVMTLMARTKFFGGGHPWSGLDPKRLGAKPPLRRSRRVNARTDHPKEA
ncbi:protein translocase subunit SecD [Streptomyces sp. FT05W]|uniref:Protein translocase subunit SecD n=1 Tax=[Kitasatospora] papulosa TaxID=1464011 RepID=A0ABZ1K1N2_9ACTN|nr:MULTISPECIES: protein translocase subunit SecD [Streptomyces]MYT58757.1 protein translocase subunit SecD [Streptomyces sp. SID7834]RAS28285.1 preprotein translocase subunit SecD [Streptomyces avidinii]TPM94132.1 protein translocase subunit SecD [Mesorhizobium sp. B2-3-3]SNX79578.1 preprotein translocase subunit SecD [Streptomyces microflavus]AGJ53781.1 protein-export membrane protein SecD [Streptomyces sp. PAMC 26508]